MKKSTSLVLGFTLALTVGASVANADWNGLPDSSMTPGAFNSAVTQANIKTTICVSGYTATIRPKVSYTENLKISQIHSGYIENGDTKVSDYEEDHLVPLEIGGNPTSTANLWPELWNGPVGAHVKDKLENKIHSLVCKGSMTLAAGRAIFATNWEAGYQKYVGALNIPSTPSQVVTPQPAPSSVPSMTPTPVSSPVASPIQSSSASPQIITPGAFCSDSNATGISKSGVTYTCKTSATDSRPRWRK